MVNQQPNAGMITKYSATAKSLVRFVGIGCGHFGERRNLVFSIPRDAVLDPGACAGLRSRVRRGDGFETDIDFGKLFKYTISRSRSETGTFRSRTVQSPSFDRLSGRGRPAAVQSGWVPGPQEPSSGTIGWSEIPYQPHVYGDGGPGKGPPLQEGPSPGNGFS